MIKLIGIAGAAGSGKSTVGTYLEDVWGYRGYALADPIKFGLHEMLGLSDYQLWGDEKELALASYGKSPRQLMQSLGDWGRDVRSDLWLTLAGKMLSRMDEYETMGHRGVVITDIRYEIEAAFVRDRGGVIIHLDRAAAAPVHEHSSEYGVRGSHYTDICITNNGTLDELYCKLSDVMDGLGDKNSNGG